MAFYGNGDGVICANCMGFGFDTVSFERNAGAYSFQWRVKTSGFGPLDMRNVWFENDSTSYNSVAYCGLGGYNIFGRAFLSTNASPNANLRLLHLFDDNDALTVDNVNANTITAHGIDIGQLFDLSDMYHYLGTNAAGNAISGHVHLANIINSSTKIVNASVGYSINGTLAVNNVIPNTVTSLA